MESLCCLLLLVCSKRFELNDEHISQCIISRCPVDLRHFSSWGHICTPTFFVAENAQFFSKKYVNKIVKKCWLEKVLFFREKKLSIQVGRRTWKTFGEKICSPRKSRGAQRFLEEISLHPWVSFIYGESWGGDRYRGCSTLGWVEFQFFLKIGSKPMARVANTLEYHNLKFFWIFFG